MIENVRGLSGRKFDGDPRRRYQGATKRLGYTGDWELFEAHEFGVPQLRPRSILVVAQPEVWEFFKWPTPGEVPTRTVGDVLYPLMASRGWQGAGAWRDQAQTIAPTLVGGSKKHGGADLGPTRAKRQWRDQLGVDAVVLVERAARRELPGHTKADRRDGGPRAGIPGRMGAGWRRRRGTGRSATPFPRLSLTPSVGRSLRPSEPLKLPGCSQPCCGGPASAPLPDRPTLMNGQVQVASSGRGSEKLAHLVVEAT